MNIPSHTPPNTHYSANTSHQDTVGHPSPITYTINDTAPIFGRQAIPKFEWNVDTSYLCPCSTKGLSPDPVPRPLIVDSR